MKLPRFSPLVVAVTVLAVSAATFASMRPGWHSYSQSQRNQLIVNRAYAQNGQFTGQSCKEWVRTVVYSASGQAVWLPSTVPNNYQWYPSSDVYTVPYCPSIYSAGPGAVIQMVSTSGTPHTAIVTSTTGSGMNWIDCNWNRDMRVTTHYISYSQFASSYGNFYTVNYIK